MTNPFIELSTDDVDRAKKFYKATFGWKMHSMPQMNYTMIDTAKAAGGGGGITKKMMPGQPTAWLPYVTVDSVKKSMTKATKAGAKAVVPFQSIGEMGAIGVFIDPTGAALGIWEPAKKVAKKATKNVKTAKTAPKAGKATAKKALKRK